MLQILLKLLRMPGPQGFSQHPFGCVRSFRHQTSQSRASRPKISPCSFLMALRSESAVSATHRAKDREVRLAHAFDRLHAIPYCPKTMCAQPCCESTFGRTPRTKCAASCALFCDLIKKSTSRLRLERGAGALLSYRVAQPGKGSTLRVRRPHPLRSRVPGAIQGFSGSTSPLLDAPPLRCRPRQLPLVGARLHRVAHGRACCCVAREPRRHGPA